MFDAHLDRQIVVALFPVLRAQWQLSDVQLGSLVSIVSLMVAACAVPGALLADRAGHARALVAMVVLWNAATLACAAAGSYGTMVGLRALVGVAQAAFGAVSAAMLAALFPPHARGTILGLFLAAGLVGNALGVFVGGVIAARWDWSTAFAAAALPGFALAVLLLALGSRAGAGPVARAGAPWLGHLRRLIRTRTLLLLCLGGGFQLLTVAALASWTPAFLYRSHGLDVARAGSAASLVLVVGVLGAVGWGVVCDRLGIPACLAAATAALATCTFALASPGTLQYALMIATGAVMTGYLGPVAAAVADVAPPAVRATANAYLALAH
ncbi:MAG: MFS transporter, partial [Burkholderiales bacterium]|nr:MFS transporter [Burkholderiales bacterium]